jgi:toxin ParE1/3/4
MVYKVVVSSSAKNDMLEIGEYIAVELLAPNAAGNHLDAFETQIADLNYMPKRFALVFDERLAQMGIRSVDVKNYTLFYHVDDGTETVTIISVMYSRRDWMNLL